MRILLILSLLISTITYSQEGKEVNITNSENMLIGVWKYVKTVDKEGNNVEKISLDRNTPNGKPITLVAKGPDIVIHPNRTYIKTFTPQNSDQGNWRIKSSNEIEYEMVIPKNSRQGKLIVQTQKLLSYEKWQKDGKGNFLDTSSDKIIELTATEMKVEYEENYVLIYKKVTE